MYDHCSKNSRKAQEKRAKTLSRKKLTAREFKISHSRNTRIALKTVDLRIFLCYNAVIMNVNDNIKQNLIFLRKQKKLTQIELADAVGYSDKTVSKWETGESVPNAETLVALAKFYGVSLDTLVCGSADELVENSKQEKSVHHSKIVISIISVMAVWILATTLYVYENILLGINEWTLFVWAIPCSCIILLVFNSIWGRKKVNYLIISVFVWSLITSIYLSLIEYNLYLIFVIGAPIQVVVILWSCMKRSKKTKVVKVDK